MAKHDLTVAEHPLRVYDGEPGVDEHFQGAARRVTGIPSGKPGQEHLYLPDTTAIAQFRRGRYLDSLVARAG